MAKRQKRQRHCEEKRFERLVSRPIPAKNNNFYQQIAVRLVVEVVFGIVKWVFRYCWLM